MFSFHLKIREFDKAPLRNKEGVCIERLPVDCSSLSIEQDEYLKI
jgi:hypothetical protein